MNATELNLPAHPLKERIHKGRHELWDPVRKRYLLRTPEEFVRQSLMAHLVNDLGYPQLMFTSEQGLNQNGLLKRTDLRVFKRSRCCMLIECKAPHIPLNQKVLDQVLKYNREVAAPWVLLSNGLQHIVAWMGEGPPRYASNIPPYTEL